MKWIAKDGKLFASRLKADLHEIKLGLREPKNVKERIIKNLPNIVIEEITPKPKRVKKTKASKSKVAKQADPMKDKYYVYLDRSNKKGFEFDFTREEFEAILGLPCYYCGGKTTGLDRVNNSRGYTWENVEPCCFHCNVMKFTCSQDDFLKRVHRIALLHPI